MGHKTHRITAHAHSPGRARLGERECGVGHCSSCRILSFGEGGGPAGC